jgi:AraC-like DNA-binding protein
MNVEKLTKLDPITVGYRVDVQLPIIPLAMEVKQAGCASAHAHPRGQLIYACTGTMRVICSQDIWVVPPSQAVWVPPNQDHEVYFPGEVLLRNLFVDPSVSTGLPERCTVFKVSQFLRELIGKSVEIGEKYQPDSPGWRVMQVILDELRQAEVTELHLPMGRDQRLLRVMEALLKEPGNTRNLNQWGQLTGASGRTLARLFHSETGLTFRAWRTRLILQEAITRLSQYEPVTTVAFDLGYKSLSAFIEMFRREVGCSPGSLRIKNLQ